jgi:biotin operon repressor
MTTKKISLARQIVHTLATSTEAMSAKDLATRLGASSQRISVEVYKLKQAGTVSHDRATATYKLTDVNTQEPQEAKASKPIVQKVEIVEQQSRVKKLQKQIEELIKVNEGLREYVHEASQSSRDFERKYFDALGVIAYLEAKLFKK